jgi:hypothetical protein
MFILRQSTVKDIKLGPFVDKTDGVTYEVGMAAAMDHATTGVRLSKNGAAFADRAEATEPVYDAFGYYLVKLDTTDTNTVGTLKVIFGDVAVCLPCEANFQVIEEAVFDALYAASAAGFGTAQTGDAYAIVAHADYGNAKLVRSTTPANPLDVSATGEAGLDFANIKDATGPHTLANITVPTVTTTGTCTTNTDMRGTDSAMPATEDGSSFTALPAVTLANGAHGGAAATIALQTPINANVSSQNNIDFGAAQKASITAAVPTAAQTRAEIDTNSTQLAAIKVITDALTAAAAAKLAASAGTIVSAAAAAGTLSTTQMTTTLTEATNDHYSGRVVIWTSGVLQNQATDITDYDGATKMLTYTAVTEAPTADDTFIIV